MDHIVPVMSPSPGSRLQAFVGDHVRFTIGAPPGQTLPTGWKALLRTNLGRADALRREIIQAQTQGIPAAGASWRDVPMNPDGNRWSLDLPFTEVGYFKAKAYLVDLRGWQHWPEGQDAGFSVHPDYYRTANTVYCAFTRLFGQTQSPKPSRSPDNSTLIALDKAGFTVIPPSGKLRDLGLQLPHIFDELGCRILHLLPVNPTPTTFARFGRYGSPYAALDLTGIDPALAVFDKRSTGIDQFRELAYAVHRRGGRLFLDIVINHTGWGSVLQDNHPEWFVRNADGSFASPGAWGVTWEDLVEIKHENVILWDILADVFLDWCRRGTDGFRCDAGYKVPVAAWQYIVARVQQEFPNTLFLLEGLGGAWEATEALLTDGGMQWAYSELFQNYSGQQVATYLDHSFAQSQRVGALVHYSETHDNDRLAARGRTWSLLRNRLCALTSVNGAFGFTCGVEWLAAEKIAVHGNSDMSWGKSENLVAELGKLNRLLATHPCFFDGARMTRLTSIDSAIYALLRKSQEGKDEVLVLVNTDVSKSQNLELEWPVDWDSATSKTEAGLTSPDVSSSSAGKTVNKAATQPPSASPSGPASMFDLLGQTVPQFKPTKGGKWSTSLPPGAAYCMSSSAEARGLAGEDYRRARLQAAWGIKALAELKPIENIASLDWRSLAEVVNRTPAEFLAAISQPGALGALNSIDATAYFPCVVKWTLLDVPRATLVPPDHWLLVHDRFSFRASLDCGDGSLRQNVESIPVQGGHVACFVPRRTAAEAILCLERYTDVQQHVEARILFLPTLPALKLNAARDTDLVLLTNSRGGMARLGVDFGRIQSKYDCVLGANLHPSLPVDRHVFAKRLRIWVNADGFISPLDFRSLASFEPDPPAVWNFVANAGDGRTVEIKVSADMLENKNTTVFHFSRPTDVQATGKQLPAQADVRLTLRLDIEDRNFHWETKHNGGAEYHFNSHLETLNSESNGGSGFVFKPASDRQLRVFTDRGTYHPQPEWSYNVQHPIEQSRGQTGSGDAFSPGWFEVPLPKGATAVLVVSAEPEGEGDFQFERFFPISSRERLGMIFSADDAFGQQLLRAARAFVVRRGEGKTVIAGYPWFLDWGRDTFISARGLLAAGMTEEVKQLLITFGRFEQNGTLPNTIFGEDASNRDTSDAPLWFALVCEELAKIEAERGNSTADGHSVLYQTPVNSSGRNLLGVLNSIATHYIEGTPNGIHMDTRSGLIWSPSHFTWMDTNYPAGTPREGYPIEIQALWIRLLRQLGRVSEKGTANRWEELAAKAQASLVNLFWREELGYFADLLVAKAGQPAAAATADDALRSNGLLVVSLGLVEGTKARRCVEAARQYLVVPGALRSLAPLPVTVPLPIYGAGGGLLNDPKNPYWGHYEGDEDTRRKPAYHNGTAWTWTFPIFCEALAQAWSFSPQALASAKAYLGSMANLMSHGCLGQIPEIIDGDSPHTQRGCDAQAWGVTEALRVWKLLGELSPAGS